MKVSRRILLCAAIVLLAAAAAFAQNPPTPTSGVLLTIKDSNNNLVSAIWDSQIHTGNAIATCDPAPFHYTDAYVFQGSSWTGCDNGDDIETNYGQGRIGTKNVGNFTFTTQYLFYSNQSNQCLELECGAPSPICNTNNTICIGPSDNNPNGSVDTGFVAVTNNSDSPFTGTITLSGTPNAPGGLWCPGGPATDSKNGTLESKQTWTFALAADSSNCGGWGADLTLPITAGSSTTFPFGPDSFQVTPANSAPGDEINFRPVPVPYNNFNGNSNVLNSGIGNGQACISYASFSAQGTGAFGVCPELQTSCINPTLSNNDGPPPPCTDGETFLWSGQLNFTIDAVSQPGGVGYENFLGQPGTSCPQTTFSVNDLISFTGAAPGLDPPLKPGGSGLNCFVATYTFNSQPILQGTFSAFDGPLAPFAWPAGFNKIKAGLPVPIFFNYNNLLSADGGPVTNLNWCPFPNPASPTGCGLTKLPIPQPWVYVSRIPVSAPGCAPSNINTATPVVGLLVNYSLVPPFLRPPFVTPHEYQFLWATLPKDAGCTTLVFQFSGGPTAQPASFNFKH